MIVDSPTIAIVDDNDSVLRALGRMVRSLGMKSNTYSTAQHFLAACETAPKTIPDCLILDVQMPEISGLELQRRLTLLPYHIPVIMISARADPAARADAMEGGAIGFLRKPFRDEDLIQMLNKAISGSKI